LNEHERMIEIISRWYGLSKRSKDSMIELGRGDYEKGKNMWLNLICFMAISIYCSALELDLRENRSLNPEYDKSRLEEMRTKLEPIIGYIASRVSIL
jgi:hypothetical protein